MHRFTVAPPLARGKGELRLALATFGTPMPESFFGLRHILENEGARLHWPLDDAETIKRRRIDGSGAVTIYCAINGSEAEAAKHLSSAQIPIDLHTPYSDCCLTPGASIEDIVAHSAPYGIIGSTNKRSWTRMLNRWCSVKRERLTKLAKHLVALNNVNISKNKLPKNLASLKDFRLSAELQVNEFVMSKRRQTQRRAPRQQLKTISRLNNSGSAGCGQDGNRTGRRVCKRPYGVLD